MAVEHELREQGGEPATPLQVDQQTVQPGGQVHIVLLGPPGGIAEVDVVPIPTGPADLTHEGPDRA